MGFRGGMPASALVGQIGSDQIEDGAVTTPKLANGAATRPKVGELAIDSTRLDDLAVTVGKIANLAVEFDKIADSAVGSAKLADLSVTAAKIVDLAVSTAKIADLAVTDAKIAGLTVGKLLAGSLAVDQFITSSNYDPGIAGWAVDSNGNAEFNDVTVRGVVESSEIVGSSFYQEGFDSDVEINNGMVTLRDGATIYGRLHAPVGVEGSPFVAEIIFDAPNGEIRIWAQESGTHFFGPIRMNGRPIRFGEDINHARLDQDPNDVTRLRLMSRDAQVYRDLEARNLFASGASISGILISEDRINADGNRLSLNTGSSTERFGLRGGNAGSGPECQVRATSSAGVVSTLTYRDIAASGFRNTSSRKYKTNIADCRSTLREIMNIRVREFDMVETGEHKFGFIAEELPEDGRRGDGFDVGDMLARLTRAVQEMADMIGVTNGEQ